MKRFRMILCLALVCALFLVSAVPAFAATKIRGDADGNGVVEVTDATVIQRYLARVIEDENGTITTLGNVTGGGLNIADATAIQRYKANYKNIFHIGEEYEEQTSEPTTAQATSPSSYTLPFIPKK